MESLTERNPNRRRGEEQKRSEVKSGETAFNLLYCLQRFFFNIYLYHISLSNPLIILREECCVSHNPLPMNNREVKWRGENPKQEKKSVGFSTINSTSVFFSSNLGVWETSIREVEKFNSRVETPNKSREEIRGSILLLTEVQNILLGRLGFYLKTHTREKFNS